MKPDCTPGRGGTIVQPVFPVFGYTKIFTGLPSVSWRSCAAEPMSLVIKGTSCVAAGSFPARMINTLESIRRFTKKVFGRLSVLNLTGHEISGELETVAVSSNAALLLTGN